MRRQLHGVHMEVFFRPKQWLWKLGALRPWICVFLNLAWAGWAESPAMWTMCSADLDSHPFARKHLQTSRVWHMVDSCATLTLAQAESVSVSDKKQRAPHASDLFKTWCVSGVYFVYLNTDMFVHKYRICTYWAISIVLWCNQVRVCESQRGDVFFAIGGHVVR